MKGLVKNKRLLSLSSIFILLILSKPVSVEAIIVFSPSLELDTLGTFGSVFDIEYSDGYLYIMDVTDNHSASHDYLCRLNTETLEIETVMSPSVFPGGWTYPTCFTWHYDGAILIGDLVASDPYRPGRILRFFNDTTTVFVGQILAALPVDDRLQRGLPRTGCE